MCAWDDVSEWFTVNLTKFEGRIPLLNKINQIDGNRSGICCAYSTLFVMLIALKIRKKIMFEWLVWLIPDAHMVSVTMPNPNKLVINKPTTEFTVLLKSFRVHVYSNASMFKCTTRTWFNMRLCTIRILVFVIQSIWDNGVTSSEGRWSTNGNGQRWFNYILDKD